MHFLDEFSCKSFDRGASRWKEALWVAVRCVFFEWAFPWPSWLRVAWLRAFGARIGHNAVIRWRVGVSFPWRLEMGDHVWLGEGVMILSLAPVTIGSHVCISQRAFLCTGSHDITKREFDLKTAPICIGAHCWVAAQAFVHPGVTIGEGSIVAAGAVVKEDVPESSIVEGNPARVVRTRERE
jgi:putative colanic acid biosynthesis acetyltransferase WcaF